jgi:tRNA C32,U32 (ribose-2'-O)-methylase TrmJ
MRDIRRILNSASMDDRDVKIMRGIFRKMGNAIRIHKEKKVRAPESGEKD